MPTRAGIGTAVTAVIGLAAARLFGIFELYIASAVALALLACACAWVLLNWRALAVNRTIQPSRLHAGGTTTVTLELSNRRIVPSPVARITDEVAGTTRADAHVPPLRKNATTKASYRVATQRRGILPIGPMRTRVTDPFGLASSVRSSAPDLGLLVLPAYDEITAPPQPGGKVAQRIDRSPNRVGSTGDEFASLRPYAIGDDLRKIHWPSTARNDELVVRNEQIPEHGHSVVVLDVRAIAADEERFEKMVSAATSVVIACYRRGDDVRLITTAGDSYLADSERDFDLMLDHLAVVAQSSSPQIMLPIRLGPTGAEAAAMIVGDNAVNLVSALPAGGNLGRTAIIVRFAPSGANPHGPSGELASARVIEIDGDESFAARWEQSTRTHRDQGVSAR